MLNYYIVNAFNVSNNNFNKLVLINPKKAKQWRIRHFLQKNEQKSFNKKIQSDIVFS